MNLYELIHEFLFDCKVRELSELTCTNYEKQLNKFRHFVRENYNIIDFEELKPIHIKYYISSLQDRGCKPAYINDLLKAVKCMCAYCEFHAYTWDGKKLHGTIDELEGETSEKGEWQINDWAKLEDGRYLIEAAYTVSMDEFYYSGSALFWLRVGENPAPNPLPEKALG